jgi:hypothetical protein
MARSADDVTVVFSIASSLPGRGSGVVDVTAAWFVMTAATVVAATTEIVATLPRASHPAGR